MLTELLTPPEKHWDRSDTIGASEIAACARKLAYLKLDTPPDDGWQRRWGFGERGHNVERWAVDTMRANGVDIHHAGDDQVTRSDGFLSATADGRIGETSLDVKSFDPRMTDPFKDEHVLQARIGARLDPNATQARVIYINASDYQDQHEFGPYPELSDDEYESLKQRTRNIMTSSPEDLLREGTFGDECTRTNCPFHVRCIGRPPEGRGRLSPEQLAELQAIRQQYREAKKALAEATHRAGKLKEDLRVLFQNADVKKVTNMASVSRRASSGGRPFDVITIR